MVPQHSALRHSGVQHLALCVFLLCVLILRAIHAICHYAEYCNAECNYA
jgi:hypothetical protein